MGFGSFAQETVPEPATYSGGLKVGLNESGSKYFRLLTWHQAQIVASDEFDANFDATVQLRRSRMLLYAQLNERFLILTHFGINNLNYTGMSPVGSSAQAQLFMHDAWVEYKVGKNTYLGGGLHYWNGISRLNNQSTLNIMPLDNPRFAWATIGTSDQFARHMGVYAKGSIGERLNYRVAWNQPMLNTLDAFRAPQLEEAIYTGVAVEGHKRAGHAFSGYFNYQVFDLESTKLPYFVGTYLGTKRILSVGGGFFYHPKGTISLAEDANGTYEKSHDVLLVSGDVFYDAPIGNGDAAISAYAGYFNYDFGPNYVLGGTSLDVGTGNTIYTQLGYLLPSFSEKFRLQPYVTGSIRSMDAFGDDQVRDANIGTNLFISGHNCKLTFQYGYRELGSSPIDQLTIQAHIFL